MSNTTETRCNAICTIIYKGDEGPTYCHLPSGHDGDHRAVYSASHVPDSPRQWSQKPEPKDVARRAAGDTPPQNEKAN